MKYLSAVVGIDIFSRVSLWKVDQKIFSSKIESVLGIAGQFFHAKEF